MSVDRRAPPGAVLGAMMIFIGLAFLAVRYLDVFAGADVWPLFIIGPGLALLVLGLFLPNLGMLVGGSVVSTVGLVLAWQNMTGRWESWAYAWGGSHGLRRRFVPGRIADGESAASRRRYVADRGRPGPVCRVLPVLRATDRPQRGPAPPARVVMPAALIGIGVIILLRGFVGPRDSEGPRDPITPT